MSPFRRKKGEDDAPEDTGEVAAAGGDQPDASEWALPADAAVTADADAGATAEAGAVPEPETAAGATPSGGLSAAAVASPGIGLDAEPAAVAAAQQAATEGAEVPVTPSEEPRHAADPPVTGATAAAPPGGLLSHPTLQEKPEFALVGAFAGAFLLARILKRISE